MNPRASRAIDALRKPDASLSHVPNTIRQSIAEVIEDQQTNLERAYGILWRMPDAATGLARKLLLEAIGGREGQKRGIAYALEMFGPATEAELLAVWDEAKCKTCSGTGKEFNELIGEYIEGSKCPDYSDRS